MSVVQRLGINKATNRPNFLLLLRKQCSDLVTTKNLTLLFTATKNTKASSLMNFLLVLLLLRLLSCLRTGKDVKESLFRMLSHAFAKEMLAGIVGGEVDKLFETKGLDYLDRNQVRDQAIQNAQQGYEQRYEQ